MITPPLISPLTAMMSLMEKQEIKDNEGFTYIMEGDDPVAIDTDGRPFYPASNSEWSS